MSRAGQQVREVSVCEDHQRALEVFGGPAGLAAVDDYVNRIADAAPPLTAEQKAALRILLRPPLAAESKTSPTTSFPTAA
jgi:hypothetical protein